MTTKREKPLLLWGGRGFTVRLITDWILKGGSKFSAQGVEGTKAIPG